MSFREEVVKQSGWTLLAAIVVFIIVIFAAALKGVIDGKAHCAFQDVSTVTHMLSVVAAGAEEKVDIGH